MDFDIVTTDPCVVVQPGATRPDGSAVPCPPTTTDPDANPGGTANACDRLFVWPSPGFMEVGYDWEFRATLLYLDGTTEDVTEKATWSVTSGPATISTTGLATSTAVGVSTFKASYCDLDAFATLEIVEGCASAGVDVVLVLDRSASMGLLAIDGQDRMVHAKAAAKALINAIQPETDQVAIVTFAGVYTPGVPPVTAKEATLDAPLSNDKDALKAVIDDAYAVRGPCLFPDPITGPSTKCATGIGGGIQDAIAELASSRHVAASGKIIVVFTDGGENVNDPSPATQATLARANGTVVIVVGLDVPEMYVADLTSYASPDLAYFTTDPLELAKIFASLPHTYCLGPGAPPDEGADSPDNYTNLQMWVDANDLALTDGTAFDYPMQWNGKSANSEYLDAEPGQTPVFRTNVFGSKPAVEFDNSIAEQFFFIHPTDLLQLNDLTIIFIGTVGAEGFLLGGNAGSPVINAMAGGLAKFSFNDTVTTVTSDAFGSALSNLKMVTIRRNAGVVSFRENTTARGGGTAAVPNDVAAGGELFGASGPTPSFTGFVAEFLAYSGHLSDAQVDSLFANYFQDKWGIV